MDDGGHVGAGGLTGGYDCPPVHWFDCPPVYGLDAEAVGSRFPMSLATLLADTVTRLRAPLTSAGYGNQVRDWSAPTSVVYPARVSVVSSTEDVSGEPRTVTRWKCTVGPDADLAATDRIDWDGDVYEIDGNVERHKGLRGLHHQTVILKRHATGV